MFSLLFPDPTGSVIFLRYESEAVFFDPKIRDDKLQELLSKIESLVQPVVVKQTAALSESMMRYGERCSVFSLLFCWSSLEFEAELLLRHFNLLLSLPCLIREFQQALKQGLLDGNESFSDLSKRIRATALEDFDQRYKQDVCVPGMPWNGQVRQT